MLARTLHTASDLCCRLLTSQSKAAAPFLQQGLHSWATGDSSRSLATVAAASGAVDASTEK